MESITGSQRLRDYAATLETALDEQAARLLAPDTRKSDKELRRFSMREMSLALRMNYNSLRNFMKTVQGVPEGRLESGNRRSYSLEEIHEAQAALEAAGKIPEDLRPRRLPGDRLSVIAVYNLKGGVAKTTLTTHMAAHLAFRGFRVLLVDLDPQASASDVFDIQADLDEIPSIYDVLKYEDAVPITEAIQATYFPNLDICPGSLSMTEFEFETSASFMAAPSERPKAPWHRKIENALQLIEDHYDVVLFDTPPHMSFAVISAVYASNGMIVPLSPGMLDVVSLQKFLTLAADTLDVIEQHETGTGYDFIRFVMTRYVPSDPAQAQLYAFLKANLGAAMYGTPFLHSTAIVDASNTMQPLLEVEPSSFTRKTYDRIYESVEGMAHELEADILAARHAHRARRAGEAA